MLFDETLIKLFDTDIGLKRQPRLFCKEEKLYFFSTSTDILESVYKPGDTISGMSKVNRPSNSIFGFLKMLYCLEKNYDFAEFIVHLIHRKRVPALHNTVLILCDEGDGLVAAH